MPITPLPLGLITHQEGLDLQSHHASLVLQHNHPGYLLLLQHHPIYTIGHTPDRASLGLSADSLPHPVATTNRGGQATYHGPGQLVGYPILNLAHRGRDLHHYLRALEDILIHCLALHSITAHRQPGLTGVWVNNRKIASIGIGLRKWITHHGFALNIASDLSGFNPITPCGIQGVEMTSLSRETGHETPVETFQQTIATHFPALLEQFLPKTPQTPQTTEN